MADEKATAVVQEEFDWNKATQEQLEMVFPILLPGFDIEDFNKKGLIKRISKKAHGHSPEDIVKNYADKVEKKKKDISNEVLALSVTDVQDLLARLGSTIDLETRYSTDDMWKAYRLLEGKMKRKSITIDEARKLEKKAVGRRGRLSIIETSLENLTAPTGFPQVVAEFLKKLAAVDDTAKIGRAKSARPLAVAKLPKILGTNIMYISLSKEWKLPDAILKAAKE